MDQRQEQITNEFGAHISVTVQKHDVVNQDHSHKTAGIRIELIGPTSQSENFITLNEAKKLCELLNEVLSM